MWLIDKRHRFCESFTQNLLSYHMLVSLMNEIMFEDRKKTSQPGLLIVGSLQKTHFVHPQV